MNELFKQDYKLFNKPEIFKQHENYNTNKLNMEHFFLKFYFPVVIMDYFMLRYSV